MAEPIEWARVRLGDGRTWDLATLRDMTLERIAPFPDASSAEYASFRDEIRRIIADWEAGL